MKQKIVLIAAAIAVFSLGACKDEREAASSEFGRNSSVECLDGVEYWVRNSGYRGYMSPRIDPHTLTFVRCEDS
jgi:hypothetical protein